MSVMREEGQENLEGSCSSGGLEDLEAWRGHLAPGDPTQLSNTMRDRLKGFNYNH